MHALALATRIGTRLRPLTDDATNVAEVDGVPVAEHCSRRASSPPIASGATDRYQQHGAPMDQRRQNGATGERTRPFGDGRTGRLSSETCH